MTMEKDRGLRKSGPARAFGEPVARTENLGAFTYRGPLFTGLDINIKRGEVVTVGERGDGFTGSGAVEIGRFLNMFLNEINYYLYLFIRGLGIRIDYNVRL